MILSNNNARDDETFELNFDQKNTLTMTASCYNDDYLVTLGTIFTLKSQKRTVDDLVILYNFNDVELNCIPAITDFIEIQKEKYTLTNKCNRLSLDTSFSHDGVIKFCNIKEAFETSNELLDKEEIWKNVQEQIKYYYQFYDEKYYALITAFIIATYYHDLFNAFPYLFLNGFRNTGKTQLGNLIASLSFNGVSSVNMSFASLFRLVDIFSPTLFLDEVEQFNNQEEKQDYRSLLNSGYKKVGSDVFRVNPDKNQQLEKFKSYCPKILASINDLEDTLRSRTITIPCQRNANPEYNSQDRLPEPTKFITIRDDLYISRLLFGFQIKEKNNELKAENFTEIRFDSRFWEMIKPMIIITQFFAPEDDFQDLLFILAKINDKITLEREENEEFAIIQVLKDCYETVSNFEGRNCWVEIKLIAEKFKEKMQWEKCSSRRIGKNLNMLGFEGRKRIGSGTLALIEYDNLRQKLQSINVALEERKALTEQQMIFSDTELIIKTIAESDACTITFLKDKLSVVSGLDSKLELLRRDGLLVFLNNTWKVVK